jgi:D-amino-acid oxidase
MKIAVIGAGIFGITTALQLSKNFEVDLFEQYDDILKSTSGKNQFRVHRGYHYPRASNTVKSLLRSESSFLREYKQATINDVNHYYCISSRDSLTTSSQYLDFLNKFNLEFTISELELLNKNAIDLCVKVKESIWDPVELKKICTNKLQTSNIKLHLNSKINESIFKNYDYIIICTYASLNSLLSDFSESKLKYQFEICEKPVVSLPDSFQKNSIVIMDGPFMSIDPFGKTGNFVLGNVVHAIHSTNVGLVPEIPEQFIPLLNNGIVNNPSISNFDQFIKSSTEFLPDMKNAVHIGSMFTIRAVLPNVDSTDERPTIVRQISDKVFTIFSGKVPTCVEAADEISMLIKQKN